MPKKKLTAEERVEKLTPEERDDLLIELLGKTDAISTIVTNTDEHRTRARRESLEAIKSVLSGEQPAGDETAAEDITEDETPASEGEASAEGSAEPSDAQTTEPETAAAAVDTGSAEAGGERTSRFAEPA